MKFTKMHGTGNDYVYVNAMQEHISDPSSLAVRISDRHFGVGSDGLVLIMPSAIADFRMRMFNADGSESEMCGNASRCIGKYVYDKGLTKKRTITLETKAGVRELTLYVENNLVSTVRVDMGEPILNPQLIPVIVKGEQAVHIPVTVMGMSYDVSCVSMGNPHAVVFMTNVDSIPLFSIGPAFENHEIFPNRISAEFVKVLSPDHAQMRVWERGTGETLSCGTGACAVLVAGVQRGLLNRRATIDLPGGHLTIEWKEQDNHVYLTGGASLVFEGELY